MNDGSATVASWQRAIGRAPDDCTALLFPDVATLERWRALARAALDSHRGLLLRVLSARGAQIAAAPEVSGTFIGWDSRDNGHWDP